MRYQREKSKDWVEVEGAAELEIAELDVMYGTNIKATQAMITPLIKDCSFANSKGAPIDPRENYRRLNMAQWEWLKTQIVKSSLDEVADPEA